MWFEVVRGLKERLPTMKLRAALVPFAALLAAAAVGCSSPAADHSDSAQANETSSTWASSLIGRRPNDDMVDIERVAFGIDKKGDRLAVYLGSDHQTHFANVTAKTDVAVPGGNAAHHHLALDANGVPHIAFSSSQGVVHAVPDASGQFVVTPIGVEGTVDAIAIDAKGTVHIATDQVAVDGKSTATMSTLASGAATFTHTLLPNNAPDDIGFGVFALAVDDSGAEYLFAHSVHFVDDSPTASHSDGAHSYFMKRPAGGAFVVESLAKISSAGSIAVDASGTIHAVLAVGADDPDNWDMPIYERRGASDTTWSAPEKVYWTGYSSSILVDASGAVRVGFTGARAGFAAYAVRPPAGGWTVEIVNHDAAGTPTIALDPGGKPVMAYRTDGGYFVSERSN